MTEGTDRERWAGVEVGYPIGTPQRSCAAAVKTTAGDGVPKQRTADIETIDRAIRFAISRRDPLRSSWTKEKSRLASTASTQRPSVRQRPAVEDPRCRHGLTLRRTSSGVSSALAQSASANAMAESR